MNVFFDLETGDPDDVFALAILATHPRANLVGVTVSPGGKDQIGIVSHVLNRLGKHNVPIGAGTPKNDKPRVSSFHYSWLGKIQPKEPDAPATEVILETLKKYPDTHLVTGAPLTNIANAARATKPGIAFFQEWTCQGGFAGDNIVPEHLRLPKFNGRVTCPTYNLGGNPQAAHYLLCDHQGPTPHRRLVPKSICHGTIWDETFNQQVPKETHPGLDLVKEGMTYYCHSKPQGKALHDVVAAIAALSPEIGTWVRVKPYSKSGEWGCHLSNEPDSPMIMIDLNRTAFALALYEP